MNKNVFGQLENKVERAQKRYGSLENFFISTICPKQHMLRMEEAYSSFQPTSRQVYQDLGALETADLLDFQKQIGGFNGEFS